MRSTRTKFVVITFLVLLASLTLSSYHNGAANLGLLDCTGAEKSNFNLTGCSNGGSGCHSAAPLTSINLDLEIDSAGVPTSRYIPGYSYQVKLKGVNNSNHTLPVFGFQLTAIMGDTSSNAAQPVGIWDTLNLPPLTQLTHHLAGTYDVDLLEQNDRISASTGNGTLGSTYEETFTWVAPQAHTGTISFWSVLNASNADGHTGGDYWNVLHKTLTEASPGSTLAFSDIKDCATNSIVITPTIFHSDFSIKQSCNEPSEARITIYNSMGEVMLMNKQVVLSSIPLQSTSLFEKELPAGLYLIAIENRWSRVIEKILKE